MASRSPAATPPRSRDYAIAFSGSSHVENGTHALPCLRRLKRSSSAAATISPSTTRAAAGSWKTALIPRTRTVATSPKREARQTWRVSGTPDGMADNESKTTTDHDEIRRWAEERGGKPASVKGTESGDEDAGIARIDFPGGEEDRLDDISWDDWFRKFDEEKLAFLYQEQVKSGDESRFFKLVSR